MEKKKPHSLPVLKCVTRRRGITAAYVNATRPVFDYISCFGADKCDISQSRLIVSHRASLFVCA